MNVQDAARVLLYLTTAYPSFRVSEASAQIWADEFASVPFADVSAAVKTHAGHNAFAPTFAEVHAILDIDDPIASLTPGQVWFSICQQIGNVGTNGTPELTPLEREVVGQLGGWRTMCQSDESDMQKRLARIVEDAKQTVRKKQRIDELGGGNIRKIGA